MHTEDTADESAVPSHLSALLRSLVGRRITAATRYSWWPAQDVGDECGVKGREVFSLTAGPATIAFDSGLILAMASNPSSNSVIVWVEKDEPDGSNGKTRLSPDSELFAVSAKDPVYADDFWHAVVGGKVVAVSILVRSPQSVSFSELPNEVGLCFTLDSGAKFVASHGLHDDSDDFSMIPEKRVLASLRADLNERILDA